MMQNPPANAGGATDAGLILGWESPLRRKWQPTSVVVPGKFNGQRRLVGYSPRGCKKSDTTEHAQTPKEEFMEQWLKNWEMW